MKRVACAGLNVDAPRRYGTAGRLAAVLAAALFLTVAQSGPVRAQQHLAEEPGFGLMLMDQGEAAHAWQARLLASYTAVEVSGAVARAKVRQVFVNEDSALVDARYLFPLPDDAAVDRLRIRFGETWIDGVLEEKGEARRSFERARAAGKRAGLVESLRPNIFSTDLANIAPGELISVDLEYQLAIKPRDGVFELRLPQIITPRFMPDQHLAALDVPDWESLMEILAENGAVLETNDPNRPRDIPAAFAVNLKAGGDLAMIESPSHALSVHHGETGSASVALRDRLVPADRDFVLRWRLAAGASPAAMLFHEEWKGSHYYMAMVTPARSGETTAPPRDLRMVVDTSGSMHGEALDQAKAALQAALSGLRPEDRFEIIQFNSTMQPLFGDAVPATETAVGEARRYVRGLVSDGGTNIAPALGAALPGPGTPVSNRFRHVVFLTDGAVSNETALFALTARNLGDARLFTIGLGPAPNNWFMRKAAEAGRGAFLNIDRVEEGRDKIAALYRRLEAVQLIDLGLSVAAEEGALLGEDDVEIFPRALPDLYAGEPLYFVLRTDRQAERLALAGRLNGKPWSMTLGTESALAAPGLAKLWAREKLEDLDDRKRLGADPQAIRALALPVALTHGIAGRYTSFVAVERGRPDAPISGEEEAVPEPQRTAVLQSAALRVSGPATAAGWKQNLSIAAILMLTAAGLGLMLLRGRERPA